MQNYIINKKVGEGAFSQMFEGKELQTGKVYALKKLKKEFNSLSEINNLNEVRSLKALARHPNIIQLQDVIFEGNQGILVFEYMEKNLFEFANENQVDEETALLLVYQLLKGLQYTHYCNFIHCDIKPQNCMINPETLVLKIADFGSSLKKDRYFLKNREISTRWYRAPECLNVDKIFDYKIDSWAVGCLFFQLLSGFVLFKGQNNFEQLSLIKNYYGLISKENQDPSYLEQKKIKQLLPNIRGEVCDLIEKLIAFNPNERMDAFQALQHISFLKLRKADKMFREKHRLVPFSVFYKDQLMKVEQSQLLTTAKITFQEKHKK
jgi:renal tumor antigen